MLAGAVLQAFFWLALMLLQFTVGDQHPFSELEDPLLPDMEPGRASIPLFVGNVRTSLDSVC